VIVSILAHIRTKHVSGNSAFVASRDCSAMFESETAGRGIRRISSRQYRSLHFRAEAEPLAFASTHLCEFEFAGFMGFDAWRSRGQSGMPGLVAMTPSMLAHSGFKTAFLPATCK